MTSKQQYDLVSRVDVLYNYLEKIRKDVSAVLSINTLHGLNIYNEFTKALVHVDEARERIAIEVTDDFAKPLGPIDTQNATEELKLKIVSDLSRGKGGNKNGS